MSGGYFGYVQHEIEEAADDVKIYIKRCKGTDNKDASEYNYNNIPEYKAETIKKFKKCEKVLRCAAAMLKRIDRLASSNDSEESFHQRWDNEKYIKGE